MPIFNPEIWSQVSTSTAAYLFATVLGALWGSFANVCIYRMPPSEKFPKGRSVVKPGSHCFVCQSPVRWYDNVPLLSYLWLRGKCRDCKTQFSPRYLLVEAASAMLFGAAYYYVVNIAGVGISPKEQLLMFGIYAAFLWVLVVITFIDLDHQLILDKITYPGIPIFYGLSLLLPNADWQRGLIGAAVGYGLIRLIADGYWLLTKREGMGYGDGKLLALIGALWGWQAVFISLFLGSVIGSVISIALLLLVRSSEDESEEKAVESSAEEESAEEPAPGLGQVAVPFGPFLAAAAVVYLFAHGYLEVQLLTPW